MGAALFDRFADWTAAADAILGYSIRELCGEDPRGVLGSTAYTQPALFVVNAMTFRARLEDGKPAPDFLAGHSLGEYNALLAAGVFDFHTGLRLVATRATIMGRVRGGGMAAIIGLQPDRIQTILSASDAGRRLDVANFNSFEQTVIAGRTDDLAAVKADFEGGGARAFMPLRVSAAFHSRYMREPMEEFAASLSEVHFGPPAIPVIANATAVPYDAGAVRETLAKQIGHSVRWLDSMVFMLHQGVTEFEEVGPGTVLTKLGAQIRRGYDAGGRSAT